MKTWKNKKLKHLAEALVSLKNESDMIDFLRDVATLEELQELSNRWDVVLRLNRNQSYRKISKETGISTTTITRISHWLKNGEKGYQKALNNLKK